MAPAILPTNQVMAPSTTPAMNPAMKSATENPADTAFNEASQMLVGSGQGSLQSSWKFIPANGMQATARRFAEPPTSTLTLELPNSALLPAPKHTIGSIKFGAKW